MTLSTEVRESTREAHASAETRPFVTDLLSGASSVRSYVSLLGALLPVYESLERHFRLANNDASVALFDHRRLDRASRIRTDLRAFGQDPERLSAGPAVRAYVQTIDAATASPQRLIAHHYTRYLGDLAGGQAIARSLMTHYDLSPDALSFYDFSNLGDLVHYRRRYKDLLDLVPWTLGERTEFIAETHKAFALNAAVFDELSGRDHSESSASCANGFLRAERVHSPR